MTEVGDCYMCRTPRLQRESDDTGRPRAEIATFPGAEERAYLVKTTKPESLGKSQNTAFQQFLASRIALNCI